MEDIYNLEGNDGRHYGNMIFDPCEYLLALDREFLIKDLTGRGYTAKVNEIHIRENIVPDMEEYGEDINEYLEKAEIGDEWECNSIKIIAL